MNRKLRRAFSSGNRVFFVLLALFAAATASLIRFTPVAIYLTATETVLMLAAALYYRHQAILRRRNIVEITAQLTSNIDSATNDSVLRFPMPMVIIRLDSGEILWGNDSFYKISGERQRVFESKIHDILPGFSLRWLYDGEKESPEDISLRERKYSVYGTVVRQSPRNKRDLMATLYFVDSTELNWLRREYHVTRPVTAILLIDNYEECMKNLTDSQKSSVLAMVDEKVSAWVEPLHGLLRKYERDKYVLVFEERRLQGLLDKKFSILDEVRTIEGSSGVPVTFSIGIGKEAPSFSEGFAYAQLAIDMALSRGGDQAVIKSKVSFEFYGGRSKEIEKRTKVKSRVMAAAFTKLIQDSSQVLIMGHTGSDVDCIGAAAGMACICRRLKKNAYIVYNKNNTVAQNLISRLQALPEYGHTFIDEQTALIHINNDTLLIVVDCNRPDISDCPNLLDTAARVAVIDHHRRGADYIEKAALSFHEPYASSACELVCELLQNTCQQGDMLRVEAEAMLGGIVLDTKNFTMHTGARTFEAAAFLRGAGADTVEIKRIFQNDYASSLLKYGIIASAEMAQDNIAVAVVDKDVPRTIAAQAADELLNIEGVDASFVLYLSGNTAMISGRSLGRVNVQMILEKIGGGGHQTIAGAQLQNTTVDEALSRLLMSVDMYCEENNISTVGAGIARPSVSNR